MEIIFSTEGPKLTNSQYRKNQKFHKKFGMKQFNKGQIALSTCLILNFCASLPTNAATKFLYKLDPTIRGVLGQVQQILETAIQIRKIH